MNRREPVRHVSVSLSEVEGVITARYTRLDPTSHRVLQEHIATFDGPLDLPGFILDGLYTALFHLESMLEPSRPRRQPPLVGRPAEPPRPVAR